jgi:hypothetical protein
VAVNVLNRREEGIFWEVEMRKEKGPFTPALHAKL